MLTINTHSLHFHCSFRDKTLLLFLCNVDTYITLLHTYTKLKNSSNNNNNTNTSMSTINLALYPIAAPTPLYYPKTTNEKAFYYVSKGK